MSKHTEKVLAIMAAVIIVGSAIVFGYSWVSFGGRIDWRNVELPTPAAKIATTTAPRPAAAVEMPLPALHPSVMRNLAEIVAVSPQVFAYAHGTAVVGNKIFIGMADKAGNPFPTNEIIIFDGSNISRPTMVSLPFRGDIETMTYDAANNKIYFLLSSSNSLRLYSLDPQTYKVAVMVNTDTIDSGRKPAITTDGSYIYGITDTDPSVVFKVGTRSNQLIISSSSHIPNGHAAAVGVFGSSTELYFAGGMSNGFEKTDAATLVPLADTIIKPCDMSDDMPFVRMATSSGYVYVGCESVPYGLRIDTSDLSYDRFVLPGSSLGMFAYENDIYNAAKDGMVDVFTGGRLDILRRYRLMDRSDLLNSPDHEPAVNEILYSREGNKLYTTAWWGVKGLYEISTSTANLAASVKQN